MFKNRGVAVMIAAIIVSLSTMFSCYRSLGAKSQEISDRFFTPQNNASADYYTCPGDQLGHCVDYANRMLSAISGDDSLQKEYMALKTARVGLLEALESEDISDIYDANAELKKAMSATETALEGNSIDASEIIEKFSRAQELAEMSPYNELVREFRRKTLNVFPTNLLAPISFVEPPELFE